MTNIYERKTEETDRTGLQRVLEQALDGASAQGQEVVRQPLLPERREDKLGRVAVAVGDPRAGHPPMRAKVATPIPVPVVPLPDKTAWTADSTTASTRWVQDLG